MKFVKPSFWISRTHKAVLYPIKPFVVIITIYLIGKCIKTIIVAREDSQSRPAIDSQSGHVERFVDLSTTLCPVDAGAGPIPVFVEKNLTILDVQKKLAGVRRGGKWRPRDCLAKSRVAIVVPYRSRLPALILFLNHMHPFLQRQNLDYTVFLVEQDGNEPFNKGATLNAGFYEIVTRGSYDCFIFNDVDVLPEDDRIFYQCADHPRHLAAAIRKWNYGLIYDSLFGGAITFTRHQYQTVNGFSNAYWGWGGEDDDMGARVTHHGYKILRYPKSISHFTTLEHTRDPNNMRRFYYFDGRKQRYLKDGLNSLRYKLVKFEEQSLYTHIMIGLDRDAIMKHVHSLMATSGPASTAVIKT